MMPSNGSVRPSRKSRKSSRPPGMRRWPMANPAIVEMTTANGTTPRTIRTLDHSNAGIWATLNASTKLFHCGFDGHSIPSGVESDG